MRYTCIVTCLRNHINGLIKVIDNHFQTNKPILAQQAKWLQADRHNKLCTFTVMHKMLYHNLSGKLYMKRWYTTIPCD